MIAKNLPLNLYWWVGVGCVFRPMHIIYILVFVELKLNSALLSMKSQKFLSVCSIVKIAVKSLKSSEMNKKGQKMAEKMFRPAFGCCKHPKAGQNTQQILKLLTRTTCLLFAKNSGDYFQ